MGIPVAQPSHLFGSVPLGLLGARDEPAPHAHRVTEGFSTCTGNSHFITSDCERRYARSRLGAVEFVPTFTPCCQVRTRPPGPSDSQVRHCPWRRPARVS